VLQVVDDRDVVGVLRTVPEAVCDVHVCSPDLDRAGVEVALLHAVVLVAGVTDGAAADDPG
jgi:hypothetical protein